MAFGEDAIAEEFEVEAEDLLFAWFEDVGAESSAVEGLEVAVDGAHGGEVCGAVVEDFGEEGDFGGGVGCEVGAEEGLDDGGFEFGGGCEVEADAAGEVVAGEAAVEGVGVGGVQARPPMERWSVVRMMSTEAWAPANSA